MVFKSLCVLVLWMKEASVIEGLTLMLLVGNLVNTESCKKSLKITETQAHGYSSETNCMYTCPHLLLEKLNYFLLILFQERSFLLR